MTQYLALLRGINVGGNNLIKMAELKACFEEQGFGAVTTYIQSGNVLFEASAGAPDKLTRRIEATIAATFDCSARVVLRSRKQVRDIVERAPRGFGAEPGKYRYDVIFLKAPLTAVSAIKAVPIKDGVDQVHAGPGVLYFSRLISKVSQSRISRLASSVIYQSMTIRNWNTTTKLLNMMDGREQ
jgi:uncharacterized protein (DUF1697 family)